MLMYSKFMKFVWSHNSFNNATLQLAANTGKPVAWHGSTATVSLATLIRVYADVPECSTRTEQSKHSPCSSNTCPDTCPTANTAHASATSAAVSYTAATSTTNTTATTTTCNSTTELSTTTTTAAAGHVHAGTSHSTTNSRSHLGT